MRQVAGFTFCVVFALGLLPGCDPNVRDYHLEQLINRRAQMEWALCPIEGNIEIRGIEGAPVSILRYFGLTGKGDILNVEFSVEGWTSWHVCSTAFDTERSVRVKGGMISIDGGSATRYEDWLDEAEGSEQESAKLFAQFVVHTHIYPLTHGINFPAALFGVNGVEALEKLPTIGMPKTPRSAKWVEYLPRLAVAIEESEDPVVWARIQYERRRVTEAYAFEGPLYEGNDIEHCVVPRFMHVDSWMGSFTSELTDLRKTAR